MLSPLTPEQEADIASLPEGERDLRRRFYRDLARAAETRRPSALDLARAEAGTIRQRLATVEAERADLTAALSQAYVDARTEERALTQAMQEAIRDLQRATGDRIAAIGTQLAETAARGHLEARRAKSEVHDLQLALNRAERAVRKLEKEC